MALNIINRLLAMFLVLFLGINLAQAETDKDSTQTAREEAKIQFLLKQIANSNATFIRNGQKHSAQEAKEHLERKLKIAQGRFWFWSSEKEVTVKNFIEKIASESSTTGEPYYIQPNGQEKIKTGVWLKQKLKKYNAPKSRGTANAKKTECSGQGC